MPSSRVLFSFAVVLALLLRAPYLNVRPMHGDEAVHAIKFGALLEEGSYQYDPFEYHGPTLNYFSLIPAWLGAHGKLAEVNDATLRAVPVFFGIALILLLALLARGLSWPVVAVAALLTAISPAMTFYSRYYIQEMLLVCFTFGVIACGYRYLQQPRWLWAILTGVFLGLMHATKETFIIALAAMFVALVFPVVIPPLRGAPMRGDTLEAQPSTRPKGRILGSAIGTRHALVALSVAAVISALFFSSFFSNPSGIIDSWLTFKTYLNRAGEHGWHLHPWYRYFKWLLYTNYVNRPLWSEAFIVALAFIGTAVALRGHNIAGCNPALLRCLAIYTIALTIIYALIPYKTPWNLLGFFHGMILLAAFGAVWLVQAQSKKWWRVSVTTILVLGGAQLAWQSYQSNFKYHSDASNPYVYAHPTTEVFTIVQRVREMASAHPDGQKMYVQVICPEDDYWPLPWYLRDFPNIGWWNHVDEQAPSASLILASPKVERALVRKLYEMPPPGKRELYVPLFDDYIELRHGVELRGYVTKELWDRWQEMQVE
ncbi:TIGR03663 family protein [candidate division KSB1 bacterium]|nr:TIGR03663 family protein [candidate division KSB1 bacterium]